MSTFVRTVSHSHLTKNPDEYPRQECKPGIKMCCKKQFTSIYYDKRLGHFIESLLYSECQNKGCYRWQIGELKV